MIKLSSQPWEPLSFWEHGRFTEKYIDGKSGIVLAARVVEHNRDGVSWFIYDVETGKLIQRGTARTISLAQFQVDNDAQADKDASRNQA